MYLLGGNSYIDQVVAPDYFDGDIWPEGAMTGEAVRAFLPPLCTHQSIRIYRPKIILWSNSE
jgi:hypothetical protein